MRFSCIHNNVYVSNKGYIMKVIVIGAGLSGLAAADAFAKKGHKVKLLEASDRVGGRTKVLRYKNAFVDVGTQYYHTDRKSVV